MRSVQGGSSPLEDKRRSHLRRRDSRRNFIATAFYFLGKKFLIRSVFVNLLMYHGGTAGILGGTASGCAQNVAQLRRVEGGKCNQQLYSCDDTEDHVRGSSVSSLPTQRSHWPADLVGLPFQSEAPGPKDVWNPIL